MTAPTERLSRVATARALLDAIGTHDREAFAAALAPDARWWFQPSVARRGAGPRPIEGRANVVAMVIPPSPAFAKDSTTWEILHLVEAGDLLALHTERRSTGSRGQPYHVEYHFLFGFDGELVVDVWDIMDTLDATEQLTASA
jgi:ketosteroid isomerase-like protein